MSAHLDNPIDTDHWGYSAWLEHHKSALSRAIHSLHILAKQWPYEKGEILAPAKELVEQRDRVQNEINYMNREDEDA